MKNTKSGRAGTEHSPGGVSSRFLEKMIPLLYIVGLSTRYFKWAFIPLSGRSGFVCSSPSVEGLEHSPLNELVERGLKSLRPIINSANPGMFKAINDF
jgi:hypothetical protein